MNVNNTTNPIKETISYVSKGLLCANSNIPSPVQLFTSKEYSTTAISVVEMISYYNHYLIALTI